MFLCKKGTLVCSYSIPASCKERSGHDWWLEDNLWVPDILPDKYLFRHEVWSHTIQFILTMWFVVDARFSYAWAFGQHCNILILGSRGTRLGWASLVGNTSHMLSNIQTSLLGKFSTVHMTPLVEDNREACVQPLLESFPCTFDLWWL